MRWTPYAPAGLLVAWALAAALGCSMTSVWVLLLIAAVAIGAIELKERYRD